jgi:pimeloyl-ACP methyl ester carboxylesterase
VKAPLVCIHGFVDTPRTWELVLPRLEQHHDVLAVTLAGHAGGPPLDDPTGETLADGVEQAMDDAGLERAHLVGNSLGGHIALQLAARGRAETVVALAPAGGWAEDDDSYRETLDGFTIMHEQVRALAPSADAIAATGAGRRSATRRIVERYEHLPAELVAHQIAAAAVCDVPALVAVALRERWPLAAERITCPVRVVWGTADRLLPWPRAAARYRRILDAEWIELDGVGHCPQLDVPLETAELILGFARGARLPG